MKYKSIMAALALLAIASCNREHTYDAAGTFETTEVVVSAEGAGRILSFTAEEGQEVRAGETVGIIDTVQLVLQREQLVRQQQALLSGKPDVQKQVAVLREQIATGKRELARLENLLNAKAATQKQYDDAKANIAVLESQLEATLSTLGTNTASIDGNVAVLESQIALMDENIAKCAIKSPVDGTVLIKYAQKGEYAAPGKPLMKVADLSEIYLRAYFTSEQLADVNIGDNVTVTADFGADRRYEYEGTVTWIATDSEFTPKNIQTKDTRANLVYAVKIRVHNDGRIKIGQYGEVRLKK